LPSGNRVILTVMVARLTVIFFIILCLQAGITLTLLPWLDVGAVGDWGDNFLLAYIAQKTNMPVIREAVASGWVRGAVTGLGILNLIIAFWEIAHFRRSVEMLEGKDKKEKPIPEKKQESEVQ
jgi:hypothetical protein